MANPTSRLLELLELLQSRPVATGREIADRLGIDPRTARRYVGTLRELGIPVEGQRGVGGGYAMRPGFRLPPLMLNDDEAVAVALGMIAADRLGLTGAAGASEAALAKLHRALPETLRRRVQSLETSIDFTGSATPAVPVSGETALVLADAIRRGRRLRVGYRSFSGERTRRQLSPYGLVVHAGRWYLAAHDHLRGELRTFRVDRMREIAVEDATVRRRPAGFDAVAHVSTSLARVPWPWEIEVLLDLPVDQAAARLPDVPAELVDAGAGTLLRTRVASLEWMASVLAGLDCGFEIHRPDELRSSVRALAARLASQV